MGWPAPPATDRVASAEHAERKGAGDGHCDDRDRSREEQLQPRGAGRQGRGGAAPAPVAGEARRVRGPAAALRGGDGGVLRGASPRAGLRGAGPRGAADVAGIRPALCEGAEERRPRRGGDRRGGDAADHAVRGAEVGGAARPADAASGAVAAGERPHAADQPAAGDPARARRSRWRRAGGRSALRSETLLGAERVGAEPADADARSTTCAASGPSSTPASRRSTGSSSRRRARSAPARRLATIPGIGALNATALTAAVGEAEDFARGRDLAAWLGLVPRQMTTGGKARLGGITKRGNVYLRTLLIHGARAALPGLSRGETPLGAWLRGLLERAHPNVVVVALAAKLARIAWAVLRSGADYDRRAAARRRSQGTAGAARARPKMSAGGGSRWPDSRTASRNPGSKYGACDAANFVRTGTREAPSGRGATAPMPDTLAQTETAASRKSACHRLRGPAVDETGGMLGGRRRH